MTITLNLILPPNFTIDIGPNLQQVGAKLVSAITDLQAQMEAGFADAKQATADEHTQVIGAIQTLQDQLTQALANGVGTPDEVAAFKASMASGFDTLKTDIGGVFEPPAPAVSPPVA